MNTLYEYFMKEVETEVYLGEDNRDNYFFSLKVY